ncbi:MAG: hypothetical protein FJ240_00605 [Nitrospira sp.]|nr:hypothetical protein [Nitrospira sp.]
MDKSVKQQVRELLRKRDYEPLLDLCERDRRFWQEVRFRLFDMDENLRWTAIEMAAKLMQHWWSSGQEEKVRIYIRTLFWSMSDESGGIGWSAPQTIAEIIVNIPEIIDPYGSMMIAHSIEEPPLMKGGLWGIGRLGRRIAESVNFFEDKILAVFQSEDSEILGIAAWAMGEAGFQPARPLLEELRFRTENVQIYINGKFLQKKVGRWAEESIGKIEKSRGIS